MPDTTACQRRLIQLGYMPEINPVTGLPNADGRFGAVSMGAYNRFRAAKGKAPLLTVGMAELNADLFPEDQQAPKPPRAAGISLSNLVALFSAINSLSKGMKMDSANVDVKSAWLSSKNWAQVIAVVTAVAALFHVAIPPELGTQVLALVTAGVAIFTLVKNTWFTTSITTASAKKL